MRDSRTVHSDAVTFRIEPELKAALAEIAVAEQKPLGELLRELVRERVRLKLRQDFETEARRQCLLIAAAARDEDGDEAAILRELDANFDEFGRDLAAREQASEKKRGRKWK